MKNDQIVKLINKYEKKNEKISPDLMNNLLSANSELIDYILNSDISTRKLESCFKYSLFSTLNLKTQIFILENDNGEFGRFNDFLKIKPKFISKILKIIYNSKNSEALIYGERYLKSCKPFGSNELLIFKAILNSKNEDNASNSYAIATNYSPYVNCEKKLELTKIVADAKNPEEARDVATNIGVLKSDFAIELTKIAADAKKPYEAWIVAINTDVLRSGFVVELTKIVSNAKNGYLSSNVATNLDVLKSGVAVELTKIIAYAKNPDEASEVATNTGVLKSGVAVELTKIVADAKNPDEASEVATNIDVIESGHVLELTNLIANVSKSVATELCKMINSGYIDIVIALIDVFEKRINVNNFDAVISLITSGDYERSKNPIESLGKILRTTNNYQPFTVVYKDSAQEAVKGSRALDKAFPGIDIKGNTYIKTRKNKKENKHDNNE